MNFTDKRLVFIISLIASFIIVLSVRLASKDFCITCPDFENQNQKKLDGGVLAGTVILTAFSCVLLGILAFKSGGIQYNNTYQAVGMFIVSVGLVVSSGLVFQHHITCEGGFSIDMVNDKGEKATALNPEGVRQLQAKLEAIKSDITAMSGITTQLSTEISAVKTNTDALRSASGFSGLNTAWSGLSNPLSQLSSTKAFTELNTKYDSIDANIKSIKETLHIPTPTTVPTSQRRSYLTFI